MAHETKTLRELPSRLLAWYRRAKRDLPWRRTRDPYRIWLAETMLQQTRVVAVVPYYERFLARFPTLAALAAAPVDEVLKLWAGLGYYARARNFHAAAREVVARHGGRVPRRLDELLALPGVGRYTAGAIRSIGFNLPAPILDGNVARILARLFAIRQDVKAAAAQKRLWALAEALLPQGHARDFNQAMMELGAVVCVPRSPACDRCPVADLCEARRLGLQQRLPRKPKRKAVPHYDVGLGVVWRRGRVLIARRHDVALLGGLWEFPGGKRQADEPLAETVRREVEEEAGIAVAVGEHLMTYGHAYSHFRVTLHVFACRSDRGRPRPLGCAACRWVKVDELGDYAFPSGSRRIIEALREGAR